MADEKEPLERMAGAFEKIADEMSSVNYAFESHTETVQMQGNQLSETLDNIALAIRGEDTPEAKAEAERTAEELKGLGMFSMWLSAAAGGARQQAEKTPEDAALLAKAEALEEAVEMLRKARPS